MAEPFLAEIRMMSFAFPPKGWATCDGQLLPINQNQALFSLLGTTFGGNGQTNFSLPDLRARVPIHFSDSHLLGERAGEQLHTLSIGELPAHSHGAPQASMNDGGTAIPTGAVFGSANNIYQAATNLVSLAPATVSNAGGSQPHENMQPFLTLNFCVALQGLFPSRN